MRRNNAVILAVVLLVIGVTLIGDGIGNQASRLRESRGRPSLGHDNHRPRLLLHYGIMWQTAQTARLQGRLPRLAA